MIYSMYLFKGQQKLKKKKKGADFSHVSAARKNEALGYLVAKQPISDLGFANEHQLQKFIISRAWTILASIPRPPYINTPSLLDRRTISRGVQWSSTLEFPCKFYNRALRVGTRSLEFLRNLKTTKICASCKSNYRGSKVKKVSGLSNSGMTKL
ncbi:hypothetical protein M9H77_23467 [Catharanthus roseus]|uniref:Uncharacterized protein n=1 Tax=Catharanthus roseus TaxID=4058 RepID=A0ACC0AUC9_CATRO|nr:hypothetical protein M9H77_23467 [Catharanthus roseus]